MARGRFLSHGMVDYDYYEMTSWLEAYATKLDTISQLIMESLKDCHELSEQDYIHYQPASSIIEMSAEFLDYCMFRIDHLKEAVNETLAHYKELYEMVNCTGLSRHDFKRNKLTTENE